MINLSKILKSQKLKKNYKININNLNEFIWPFFIQNPQQNVLLVLDSNQQIHSIEKQIKYLHPHLNTLKFLAWDCQPYDMSAPKLEIQAERINTLKKIHENESKNFIILTTVKALSQKTLDITECHTEITIKKNEIINRNNFIEILSSAGFKRKEQTTQLLDFSVRGDIIDIYPNNLTDNAYRIEFFDNEIESIHILNIENQRREKSLPGLTIKQFSELILNKNTINNIIKNYPATFPEGISDSFYQELKLGKLMPNRFHFLNLFYSNRLKSLFDYLENDYIVLYCNDIYAKIDNVYNNIKSNYKARIDFLEHSESSKQIEDLKEAYRPINPNNLFLKDSELLESLNKFKTLHFSPIIEQEDFTEFKLNIQQHIPYNKRSLDKSPLQMVCEDILSWQNKEFKIFISCFNSVGLDHIKNALGEYKVKNIKEIELADINNLSATNIGLFQSPLEFGFIDQNEKTILLTQQDIFGIKKKLKAKNKSNNKKMIEHLNQLKVNDLVVHTKHGIGKFIGLETIETSHTPSQDFAIIEYQNNEKLFIPIINLDSLSLYSHAETGECKLDRLGSSSFLTRKEKVKKKLLEIAQNLIDIASKRKLIQGYKFSPVDHLYDEFAEGFEYVLTPDQESCIDDVLNDMYSHQPMDRLIIGDVGFGKTEIALRACFVSAANFKQSAIIVPTTLLARQHFKNFKNRFEQFGFKVAMLSRLNSAKENQEIKQKLKTGEIDIIIGTHALLSKDIVFDNLGLLVVDEEQRFGVTHKERLKEFKNTVDILTLSATPIPRTLHMSTSGIRDLSLITTPPVDRLPIKTTIMKYDSTTLKQALLKELYRNGQTYIITPRVNGIYEIAEKISNLVPQARIKIAHGQLNKSELEKTMIEFSEGEIDILIATTIVESGIDIENANTIIVFDSHRFGLAQLYQIRGRIGRSSHSSFAYFLIPTSGNITDQALMRLKILKKLDTIGAGFTLASYDMDIRGPGNILGSEQSGHIKQVGFSLYNTMLKETIENLKNNPSNFEKEESFFPTINVPWSFILPKDYITETNQRLDFYRRLSEITNKIELEDIKNEIIDRFGKLPHSVEKLIEIISFKITAKSLNIESLEVGNKGIVITFFKNNFKGNQEFISNIISTPKQFKLRPDHKILYICNNFEENETIKNINDILNFIQKFY